MKKRPLKKIKLNKNIISFIGKKSIVGGLGTPIDAEGSEISYCHVGSRVQCCA